jgi:hypothetical protein
MRDRAGRRQPDGAREGRDPTPAPPPRHPLLQLQRQAGNAAVVAMLQRKLVVGPAASPAEREADAIAARVAGGGGHRPPAADLLGGTEVPADIADHIASSPGAPLDEATRSPMEQAFGVDLSAVRIHRSATDADAATALQARAFTTGTDVFVGRGGGTPEVMAHELAHVVQGSEAGVQRFVDVDTFKARTSQGKFTGKSTAQKTIEKLLARYAALGSGGTVPVKELDAAEKLLDQMRTAAKQWLADNTDDGKVKKSRRKRGAGMAWFVMATDEELQSIWRRRAQMTLPTVTPKAPESKPPDRAPPPVPTKPLPTGYVDIDQDDEEHEAESEEPTFTSSLPTTEPTFTPPQEEQRTSELAKTVYSDIEDEAKEEDKDEELSESEEEAPKQEAPKTIYSEPDKDEEQEEELSESEEEAPKQPAPKTTVYSDPDKDEEQEEERSQTLSVSSAEIEQAIESWEGAKGEDTKYDGYLKAPVKYSSTKPRRDIHKDEFSKGSLVLFHEVGRINEHYKGLAEKKQAMHDEAGWSPEDFDKYFFRVLALLGKQDVQAPVNVAKVSDDERSDYQLHLGGTVTRGSSPEPYDTKESFSKFMKQGWAIFVMSVGGEMFSGEHKMGLFHHSSFFAGGDVAGAGELKVEHGKITGLTNKSGHYFPEVEQTLQVMDEIGRANLSGIKYVHFDPDGKRSEWDAKAFYDAHKNGEQEGEES